MDAEIGPAAGSAAVAPRWTLRQSLWALIVLALLPLALGGGFVLWQQREAQHRAVEQGLLDTAQALAVAIDGELATARARVEALAASPLIDAGDWAGVQRHAAEMLRDRPGTLIAVVDSEGQLLLNSVLPWGTPLPNVWRLEREERTAEWRGRRLPLSSQGLTRQVFATARPAYSQLYYGVQLQRPNVSVAVPVLREGRVRQALVLAFDAEHLSRFLAEADRSDRLRLTLIDGKGRVIAANRHSGWSTSDTVPDAFLALLGERQHGHFEDRAPDGVDIVGAHASSTLSGWTVRVTLPRRDAFASADHFVYGWLAVLGLALAAALALAALLARRLTTPLGQLADAADALQHGREPAVSDSSVREIDALRRALQRAAQSHRDHEREQWLRREAEAREAAAAHAAQVLRESGERLRRVIDRLYASVAVLELDGTLLEINRAPLEDAGLRREDVIGRPFWEARWWSHDPAAQQRLRRSIEAARDGAVVRYDAQVRMAGERRITLDFQIAPLHDEAGRLVHLVASGVDITARVATEAALRDSEAHAHAAAAEAEGERRLLDAVLQAAPVGIIVADAQGRLLRMNPGNERLWGPAPYSGSVEDYREWKGWWADGSQRHGQPLAPWDWALARALAGEVCPGDIVEIEPFGAPPGTRRTMLNCGAPVRDAQGRVVGGVIVQVDLTERLAAEAARRESEERFRALADNMSQLAWIGDENGRPLWFNRRWSDYTGLGLSQMRRGGWHKVQHPAHFRRVVAEFLRRMRRGQAWEDTFPLRRHDGEYRWFLSRAQPIRDASGRVARWFATHTDVTEQRAAEQALRESEELLRQSERALREADRQKDEFLATLAHELRNPLAPIRSAAQVIRLRRPADAAVAKAGEMIERQSAHMARLVDDLLEVSRITLGRIELRMRAEPLAAIVAGAVEAARPALDARRQRLELELPHEPLLLHADGTRLSQALLNVLNNAVKFTPEGGRIALGARREGGDVLLTVRDEGIGIAPDMTERIFELFVQARSSTTQAGLGIGLALARRLVEMHGGTISATSGGPGTGSTFTIRLPLAAGAPQPSPPSPAEPALGAAGPVLPPVLVVDDNVDAAEALRMVLELEGHEVRIAHDGGAALAAYAAWRPPVVVLDIGLPDIDGCEVARRLRALHPGDAPLLVALTGWGQAADRQRAREAGFDHHFTKPVDPQTLLGLLRRVPDGARTG